MRVQLDDDAGRVPSKRVGRALQHFEFVAFGVDQDPIGHDARLPALIVDRRERDRRQPDRDVDAGIRRSDAAETAAGFARTERSTRTRSVESTRTRSEGSSNVMVISDGSSSPQSIFRARSSDRRINASTVPDDTVTRRAAFLMGFVVFFIFVLPKLSDLVIEPRGQSFVPPELERFLPPHE